MLPLSVPAVAEITAGQRPLPQWQQWFSTAAMALMALTQSGTSAQRPTRGLWAGRMYFDTTLGLPIWYEGPGWVKADGTAA